VEPATRDRIQRMIDDEATERFPPGAVPRLVLLRYGDHAVIEPGELYLPVILGQDGATRDAWMQEHFDRLEAQRAGTRTGRAQSPVLTPAGRRADALGVVTVPRCAPEPDPDGRLARAVQMTGAVAAAIGLAVSG
jgi:hypothetical protein